MGNYDDIIDLPHPTSRRHPRMTLMNRAAQFAPFAALTGFGDTITEAARLTDRWIDLTEAEKEALSRTLAALREGDAVEITYFIHDLRKDGGRYATERAVFRRVIPEEARLTLADGRSIDLDELLEIEPIDDHQGSDMTE